MMFIFDNPPTPPHPPDGVKKQIIVAVATAVLVAAATKAVDWLFEELKAKYGSIKPSDKSKDEDA